MSDTAIPAALAAERLELCEFLHSLDEQDWTAPSLCAGWTVQDVVAHLTLSTRTSAFDFAKGMLRHRGDFDRMNALDARRRAAEFAPAELLGQLQGDAHSTKKSFGSSPADGLTDVIVHGQSVIDLLLAATGRLEAPQHLSGNGVEELRRRLTQ